MMLFMLLAWPDYNIGLSVLKHGVTWTVYQNNYVIFLPSLTV